MNRFFFSGKSALSALAILGLSLTCSNAYATTTQTTTFGVSATVQGTCLISATSMAFGTYTGVAATSASTVQVTCTNTTAYNIGFSAGTGSSATVSTRKMTGPSAATLNYALYSDSNRSVNWGQTVGTDTVTGTGNGLSQTLNVYGAVPAGQYVTPGAYADTITATITY